MCESTSVLQRQGERREGRAVSSPENKLQFRPNEEIKRRRRQTNERQTETTAVTSDGFVHAAEFHATGHPLLLLPSLVALITGLSFKGEPGRERRRRRKETKSREKENIERIVLRGGAEPRARVALARWKRRNNIVL